MLNLPNLLSLLRVLLIPVLVVLYFLPSPYAPLWATIVFVLAGITDWLDGYLARRMNLTSPFGAFIDPVADKLIVVAEIGARHVVQVSSVGKWKTTFQMVAIGCLIFYKPLFGLPVFEIGVGLLYIAALLTLTSMISYLKAALPVLVDKG